MNKCTTLFLLFTAKRFKLIKENLANVIRIDDQQISCTLNDNGRYFGMSVIYALTYYIKKRLLWQSLSNVQNCFNLTWSCIGDFKIIIGIHKEVLIFQLGCIYMKEFLNWLDNNNLMHLPTKGFSYT